MRKRTSTMVLLCESIVAYLGGLDASGEPRKRTYDQWLLPVLKLLARGRRLRGSWLDSFGYSRERRLERKLAEDYARMIDTLLPALDGQTLTALLELAALPEHIRGYGQVKLASINKARDREQELLAALDWPAKTPPRL